MSRRLIEVGGYFGPDRRERNGTTKLIWWMLTTTVGLLLMGGYGWMGTIQAKNGDQDEKISVIKQDMARVDTREDAHWQDVKRQLDKIDTKMDALTKLLQQTLTK